MGDITTTKNFRIENVTHSPRKQGEPISEVSMSKPKVRGFEPVSQETIKRMKDEIYSNLQQYPTYITDECILPQRGSKKSAGYDVFAPCDIYIKPGEKALIWTNVKAYMQEGEVLLADIRSSAGIKLDLMLANTVGVIDADYYNNPSNEGNIGICIRNLKPSMNLVGYNTIQVNGVSITIPQIQDLVEHNTIHIKKGERIAQLFFVKYFESDNCNSSTDRVGGIGSTGR